MSLDTTAGLIVGPFSLAMAVVPTSIGHALFFRVAAARSGIHGATIAVKIDIRGASLIVDFARISTACPALPAIPGRWASSALIKNHHF